MAASYTAVLFATILKVYDGDTVKVDINNCDIDIFCRNIEIRFLGYDSPEIRGRCDKEKQLAQEAKKYVQERYPIGSNIVLSGLKRDKYFRIDAEVPQLRKAMLEKGLAVPYYGGKKVKDWCN